MSRTYNLRLKLTHYLMWLQRQDAAVLALFCQIYPEAFYLFLFVWI
jgi:hypothetical protein